MKCAAIYTVILGLGMTVAGVVWHVTLKTVVTYEVR